MSLGKLASSAGSEALAVTTAHTGKRYFALVINTDATFTTLTATNGQDSTITVNMLTAHGYTGFVVSQGQYITPPANHYFSAITMSSGNAIGHKYGA